MRVERGRLALEDFLRLLSEHQATPPLPLSLSLSLILALTLTLTPTLPLPLPPTQATLSPPGRGFDCFRTWQAR